MAAVTTPRPAVILNMHYTGLAMARSLGRRGIPVIGLSAQKSVYGAWTRYAEVRQTPDSRDEPEDLYTALLSLARELGPGAVLFPTRDHDVVFLDRYRRELTPHFQLILPGEEALHVALDKGLTYEAALRAGVATPATWTVNSAADLAAILGSIRFPCVLKPVEAHHWRQQGKWEAVGSRKAICLDSAAELTQAYRGIAAAEGRALVQEAIPGGDDALLAVGCYVRRDGSWGGAFGARKLIQTPAGYGTGCVLESADCSALVEPTRRLLAAIGFRGIAEVEYKRHAVTGEHQLIEINPRPWDQHGLGRAAGVEVCYLAYCDATGQALAAGEPGDRRASKWIAEDAFLIEALRLAGRRDPGLKRLLAAAAGRRMYGIWDWADPLPGLSYLTTGVPALAVPVAKAAWAALRRRWSRAKEEPKRAEVV
ncbi:MAG: hypothetical protein IT162_04185 [Bryobacterales bacterium]|nr:hypothetical protein [Bryobacterales bacterium]